MDSSFGFAALNLRETPLIERVQSFWPQHGDLPVNLLGGGAECRDLHPLADRR